jgi:inner membrane protein
MIELLGWVATAMFVSSYFFKRPVLLRAAQMSGATLWIVYGALIGAVPVVVANALVFTAAAWTMMRERQTPLAA